MAPFEVVVAGHICLDIIPQIPPIDLQANLKPGALLEIGEAVLSTGGTVSNAGRALHRLGVKTGLMGKVGDDPFGRIVLELLNRDDPALAQGMIVAPGEVTSYTLVISPRDVDRTFLHCAGANHTFGAGDVNYERLKGVRFFHFGYPPVMERMYAGDGAELADLFRRVKEIGAITSLDMAKPDPNGPSGRVDWRRVMERTLPYVDLFLPSLDEMIFMLRRDPPISRAAVISGVAGELLDMGAGVVGLKVGDQGFYLRTGPAGAPDLGGDEWRARELWAPCFKPDPLVGTTGAGDATIAGFLAAILRGQSVEGAMTSAVAVGACNVEAADALSGVRSWAETQARIRSGWPRLPLTVDVPGWRWDADRALWIGPFDRA
jgi:sugar/nucleoside kinase (ribokinase family)